MKQRASPCSRRPQRGVVVIVFGLMLVVLIGFAGLVIDLGRLFVIKTELQNAMDAWALSAASQLRPGFNTAADLQHRLHGHRESDGGEVQAVDTPVPAESGSGQMAYAGFQHELAA